MKKTLNTEIGLVVVEDILYTTSDDKNNTGISLTLVEDDFVFAEISGQHANTFGDEIEDLDLVCQLYSELNNTKN